MRDTVTQFNFPKKDKASIIPTYQKPPTRKGQEHTEFDYNDLVGEEFMKYCQMVEGDIRELQEFQIALRMNNGKLSLNKEYQFDIYYAYPVVLRIDSKDPKSMKIVAGIQLKDGKAVRTKTRMTLKMALTINRNISFGSSNAPVEYLLLNQSVDIFEVAKTKPNTNQNTNTDDTTGTDK